MGSRVFQAKPIKKSYRKRQKVIRIQIVKKDINRPIKKIEKGEMGNLGPIKKIMPMRTHPNKIIIYSLRKRKANR